MRRARAAMSACGAALVLVACGGGGSTTAADSEESTAAASSTATTRPSATSPRPTPTPVGPPTNARGNLVKAFGEQAGFLDQSGGQAITFVVEGIAPLECTEPYYDYAPENGVIIGVQLRVTTGTDLTGLEFFTFDGQDFAFIGADGVTRHGLFTLPAYACLPDSEQFTSEPLGPGQTYVGTIALDAPAASGTLIYAPSAVSNINGWEWTF